MSNTLNSIKWSLVWVSVCSIMRVFNQKPLNFFFEHPISTYHLNSILITIPLGPLTEIVVAQRLNKVWSSLVFSRPNTVKVKLNLV